MSIEAIDVALAIKRLAEEHGTPNFFHLQEFGLDKTLEVSRILRWDAGTVDGALKPFRIKATYRYRQGKNPAGVQVDPVN